MLYQGSYKAGLPLHGTLKVAASGKVICGEFGSVPPGGDGGGVADPFGLYYVAKGSPAEAAIDNAPDAPHIQFANCDPGVSAILDFTRRWGPLLPNCGGLLVLPRGIPELIADDRFLLERCFPDAQVNPECHFAFRVEAWRHEQRNFKSVYTMAARPAHLAATDFNFKNAWPDWTLSTLRNGGYSIEPDAGYSIQELRKWWTPDYARNDNEIRRIARLMNVLVTDGKRPQELRMRIVCRSLLHSFWLMLAFDLSDALIHLRKCRKCGREFRAKRSNQFYCVTDGISCAQRVASLKNYHKKKRAQDPRP